MIRSRGAWVALSALVLAAALLGGCGGSGSTTTTSTAGVGGVSDGAGTAVLTTRTTPDPVRIVADADGMTVYEFRRDNPMLYQFTRDPAPTCYGACAAIWSPVLTDEPPLARAGAEPAMVGTIKRRDGGLQVTYDDHPLYLFTGDRHPGEMNGQEVHSFGAGWHAVERDGDELLAVER